MQPSHSRLTEDRVFIPRTCSTCRAEPTAPATALLFRGWRKRNFVKPFRIVCEKGRDENAPRDERRDTEGRSWRRALEAPRTLRRENIVATEAIAQEILGGGAQCLTSRGFCAGIQDCRSECDALLRSSRFLRKIVARSFVSPNIRGGAIDWCSGKALPRIELNTELLHRMYCVHVQYNNLAPSIFS